jgi:hypothetical protein
MGRTGTEVKGGREGREERKGRGRMSRKDG